MRDRGRGNEIEIEIKFNYLLALTLFSGSVAVADPRNAPPNPVQEIVIVEQPLVVSTVNIS